MVAAKQMNDFIQAKNAESIYFEAFSEDNVLDQTSAVLSCHHHKAASGLISLLVEPVLRIQSCLENVFFCLFSILVKFKA